MQILIVVCKDQCIAFLPEITPIERQVRVGKTVGQVRHPLFVGDVFRAAADRRFLVVANVHLRIVSSYAQPVRETVTGGEVVSFGQHFAVVDVARSLLTATQVGDVTLDIIVGVTVDQTSFDVNAVLAECLVVADIQVHVVALLRFDADVTHFEVFVTEHLFDGGEAVGFLVGEFCLQSRQDEVSSCRTVSQGTDAAGSADIFGTRIVGRHRTCYILVVMLAEDGEVPVLRRHQSIRQTGNVLARLLVDGIRQFLVGQQRGVGTAESGQYIVESERMGAAQTVIDRYRTIPVIVVRPCMLVRLLATRIHQVLLATPVIFVGGGVDIGRQVLIVIGGEDQVEPFGQQVAFVVFERRHLSGASRRRPHSGVLRSVSPGTCSNR